jgi:acyl carrier protein
MRRLDRIEIDEHAAAADTATIGAPTTLETMRRVLVEHYGIDANLVGIDQRLDSLGLDSLSFFEYIFELEKVLHILLPDLPRDLVTVGDLVRFVEGELARKVPTAATA